jgi:hypothetical protein
MKSYNMSMNVFTLSLTIIYVQIGDKRHVFMVYTKNDKHGSSTKEVDWHHHTFYFRSNINKASISLGSMTGNTGILFDDIKIQQAILHDHDDSEVLLHNALYLHIFKYPVFRF